MGKVNIDKLKDENIDFYFLSSMLWIHLSKLP